MWTHAVLKMLSLEFSMALRTITDKFSDIWKNLLKLSFLNIGWKSGVVATKPRQLNGFNSCHFRGQLRRDSHWDSDAGSCLEPSCPGQTLNQTKNPSWTLLGLPQGSLSYCKWMPMGENVFNVCLAPELGCQRQWSSQTPLWRLGKLLAETWSYFKRGFKSHWDTCSIQPSSRITSASRPRGVEKD